MEDDWDLHAVVRGCTTVTSSSSSTTTTTASSVSSSALGTCYQPSSTTGTFFPIFPAEQAGRVLSLSNPFEAKNSIEELHELYKPFFPKSHPPSLQTSSPLSSFSYSSAPKSPQPQQKQQQQQQPSKQSHHAGSASTPRSKRRKNQLKKVCQVAAENLSSDIWAWRKYGQKPIKGSPYPRGYYRCSSSKGCLARKQVERNKSDPTMFIVTYTGEHSHPAPTHRNSLAGSTRQKPLTPQSATAGESAKSPAKPVSPATSGAEEEEAAHLSATKSESKEEDMEDLMNDDDEENNEFGFGLSDMVVTDDFFEGLEELTGSGSTTGDSFVDPFAANNSIALPSWVANNAATAAGGS